MDDGAGRSTPTHRNPAVGKRLKPKVSRRDSRHILNDRAMLHQATKGTGLERGGGGTRLSSLEEQSALLRVNWLHPLTRAFPIDRRPAT
jgi:hypothetical protein